jgi:hypothetical protein
MKDDKNNSSDLNPDNEFRNSVPHNPEIEQPDPSTATPSIPQEMPIREG